MMETSLKVIIYLVAGSVCLLCVKGHKGEPVHNCLNPAVKQRAFIGGSVTFQCEYTKAKTIFTRRFCRKDETVSCTDVISAHTADVTKKERYSLQASQKQGVYNVTISQLTLEDSGRYLCGVDTSESRSFECVTEISLQILSWDDIEAEKINGSSGGHVRIKCPYPRVHVKNEKFLCKGPSPFSCEAVIHTEADDRDVTKDRFKIRDNRRLMYFYVHMRDLSTADSGTYWCGSDRTWQQDQFNKTLLTVGRTTKKFPSRSSSREKLEPRDNSPDEPGLDSKVLIGGAVGCLALLLIILLVLILFGHKIFRTPGCCAAVGPSEEVTAAGQSAEQENPGEPHYEEIQIQDEQQIHSIYVEVNRPADQVHYSSVSVRTDRDALQDTNKDGCSARDQSSVLSQVQSPRQAPIQTLYSSVVRPKKPHQG